jgi:hypothetical protein
VLHASAPLGASPFLPAAGVTLPRLHRLGSFLRNSAGFLDVECQRGPLTLAQMFLRHPRAPRQPPECSGLRSERMLKTAEARASRNILADELGNLRGADLLPRFRLSKRWTRADDCVAKATA